MLPPHPCWSPFRHITLRENKVGNGQQRNKAGLKDIFARVWDLVSGIWNQEETNRREVYYFFKVLVRETSNPTNEPVIIKLC